MKRFLIACALLVTLTGTNWAGEPGCRQAHAGNETTPPDTGGFVLHLDIERLQATETGNMLIRTVCEIPFVASQIRTIPDELKFLTKAEISALTITTSLPGCQGKPVLHALAKIDEQGLFRLIRHGNGYAKVEYEGVTIHHWMAHLESLGHCIMGESPESSADETESQPVFLACPREDEYVVSTSLAAINIAIDRILDEQPIVNLSQFSSRFGAADNIACYEMSANDGFPGNLSGVLRENESGQAVLQTAIRCRSAQDRVIASLINKTLNNSDLAIEAIRQFAPSPEAVSDEGQAGEAPAATGDNGNLNNHQHHNSLTLGLKFDSRGFMESDDRDEIIRQFLADCLKCELRDDLLTIDAQFFVGPCEAQNRPRNPQAVAGTADSLNNLSFVFNAYSTADRRDEAIRIANSNRETAGNGKSESSDEGTLIR